MKRLLSCIILLMIAFSSFSQIQWHHVNGPNGARVLCVGQNSNGDIFEGNGFGGGLYKLADSSNVWSNVLKNKTITHILFNNNEIFLSADESVLHSTDNGSSWSTIGIFPNSNFVHAVAIDNKNNLIYVRALSLYVSADTGQTWIQRSGHPLDIVVDTSGTLFTCLYGISRSYDFGLTFSQVFTNGVVSRLAINSYNELFAGADFGILKSIDGGDSWIKIDTGFTDTIIADMVIDSNDDIYALTSDGEVHISKDRGHSWSHYPTNIVSPTAILHDEMHHKILIGDYGNGIYSSNDSLINWIWSNDSLNNTFLRTINKNLNGDLYCGTDETIFKSVNNGETWNKLDFPLIAQNGVNDIAFNSLGHIFALANNSGVYRSLDSGLTWQNLDTGLIYSQMLKMAINSDDDIFVADLNHGIFRSVDNGNNWQQLDTVNISKSISAVAITKNNSVLAGEFWGDYIFRSTDNGNTWQTSTSPNIQVDRFMVLSDSSIIAYDYSSGVYVSYDDGINWTLKSNSSFWDMCADMNNVLYGVTPSTLSVSYNHGQSWSVLSNMLEDFKPWILYVLNSNIFIGTSGNGIYKSDSVIFTSVNNGFIKDLDFEIFPNPASKYIQVETSQNSESDCCRIEILNIHGQIIKRQISNDYFTTMDISDISSGVYLIKIKTDKNIAFKKFVKQ